MRYVAADKANKSRASRILFLSGTAHALHDGYTDLILVLLPLWQTEFALGYGALALLRSLYNGAMAGFQIPAGRLSERFGPAAVLGIGTALAALGFALAGFSGGLLGLGAALFISGAGSSTQHPVGSSSVARAYGAASRGPLGVYNFSGDLGKAAFPAAGALLLTLMPWREMLWVMAGVGLAVAALAVFFMPRAVAAAAESKPGAAVAGGRGGFPLLMGIGVLDTSVRSGFLIFLPFLLTEKGADLPTIGLALALVFIGGAAGKFTCGWLGARLGVMWTVIATEGGTALAIVAILFAPLSGALVIAPLLGVMLNGTSSVLYGTVPELAPDGRTERAFALFYTGGIGASAIAPVLFGLLGDAAGLQIATLVTAVTALATLPLVLLLAPRLRVA